MPCLSFHFLSCLSSPYELYTGEAIFTYVVIKKDNKYKPFSFCSSMLITEEHLQKAGLTRNEAKVYLLLIQEGAMIANALAKRSHIDRSLTYTILNNLTNKGMVTATYQQTKKHF